MTNLKQLATELLEKAAKATPEKVNTITKGVVNAAGKQIWHMSGHPGFEPQAKRDVEYYAAASPDVIAALASGFLEQAERLEKLEAAHLEAVEAVKYYSTLGPKMDEGFLLWDGGKKARAFLSKHGLVAAPGEGEIK